MVGESEQENKTKLIWKTKQERECVGERRCVRERERERERESERDTRRVGATRDLAVVLNGYLKSDQSCIHSNTIYLYRSCDLNILKI